MSWFVIWNHLHVNGLHFLKYFLLFDLTTLKPQDDEKCMYVWLYYAVNWWGSRSKKCRLFNASYLDFRTCKAIWPTMQALSSSLPHSCTIRGVCRYNSGSSDIMWRSHICWFSADSSYTIIASAGVRWQYYSALLNNTLSVLFQVSRIDHCL